MRTLTDTSAHSYVYTAEWWILGGVRPELVGSSYTASTLSQQLIKTCIDPDGWGGLQQGPQSEGAMHCMLVVFCMRVSVWRALWSLFSCLFWEYDQSRRWTINASQLRFKPSSEFPFKKGLSRGWLGGVWGGVLSWDCLCECKHITQSTLTPASSHKRKQYNYDGVQELRAHNFVSFHPTSSFCGGLGSHCLGPQSETLIFLAHFLFDCQEELVSS